MPQNTMFMILLMISAIIPFSPNPSLAAEPPPECQSALADQIENMRVGSDSYELLDLSMQLDKAERNMPPGSLTAVIVITLKGEDFSAPHKIFNAINVLNKIAERENVVIPENLSEFIRKGFGIVSVGTN